VSHEFSSSSLVITVKPKAKCTCSQHNVVLHSTRNFLLTEVLYCSKFCYSTVSGANVTATIGSFADPQCWHYCKKLEELEGGVN
jgi:hypothetical protein